MIATAFEGALAGKSASAFRGFSAGLDVSCAGESFHLRFADGSVGVERQHLGRGASLKIAPELLLSCLEGSADLGVALRKRSALFDGPSTPEIFQGMRVMHCALALAHLSDVVPSPLLRFYAEMEDHVQRAAITSAAASMLYRLTKSLKPTRTLEVGFAHGYSALVIANALRENGVGSHVGVDPFQDVTFNGSGLQNVAKAGFSDLVRVLVEPDFSALPRLLETAERFQLVLLDGNHMTDYTFLDFFYAERLLDLGGIVVFDDVHLDEVDQVVQFVVERRKDFEPMPELSNDRHAVFKKVGADTRTEFSECQYLARRRRV